MVKELCLAAVVALCTSLVAPLDSHVQIKQIGQEKQFNKTVNTAKNAPTRVGKQGTMVASLEKRYSLDEASDEADIVAEVEISEWLNEIDEEYELPITFYKAKLLNTFKNSVNPELKEIVVVQTGNSKFTIDQYPLFQNGDKLILFLKAGTDLDIKNGFWILGSYSTVLTVKNIGDTEYAAKLIGAFSELHDISVEEPENLRNSLTIENLSQDSSSIISHQTFIKKIFEAKLKNSIKRAGDFQ